MNVSGYHTISSFTHTIGNSGWTTNVEIKKNLDSMKDLFREKVDVESEAKPFKNLNDMKDSYTVYFNETPINITLTNCEIVDEILQLSASQTQGTAVFTPITTNYDVSQCELRKYVNYPYDQNDSYEVSANGGIDWEDIDVSSGSIHTFSNTGSGLALRITLNRDTASDPSPAYESVCLLYK